MDKKPMGTRVRKLRERKAWTQEHLAAAADVSVRTIQRAEEGVMSAETLKAIAGALDESVEAITSPKSEYPSIVPILYYDDPKTLEWLVEVFGFEIRMQYLGPDGKIAHAELAFGDGVIMCGQPMESMGWVNPTLTGGARTNGTYVNVDDVEAHFRHARDAGAEIVSEPESGYGQKRYRVKDPEGYEWSFAEQLG